MSNMEGQQSSPRTSPAVISASSTQNSNPNPLTVKSVLASHSAAPNPHLAALDQVVTERNTLSSQNSQLWKLVEKQRSGYSQILKELERVRAERDIYKTRLETIGDDPDQVLQVMKKHRKHKSSKHAHKSSSSHRTDEQANPNDPKFTMVKTEDPAHKKTPSTQDTSLEPIVAPPRGTSLQPAVAPNAPVSGNNVSPLNSATISTPSSGLGSAQFNTAPSSARARSPLRSESLPRAASPNPKSLQSIDGRQRSESFSSSAPTNGYTNGGDSTSQLAHSTNGTDAEFLDLGEETSGDERSIRSVGSDDEQERDESGSGSGSAREQVITRKPSAEDFPMPPAGSQNTTPSHSRGLSGGTLETIPGSSSQSLNSYSLSISTSPAPRSAEEGPQPQFRALPLLAGDLPHTKVQVSHSSIRPNDRGKEVLSFVIVVDAGNGKDSWSIEKLYSDVISLDNRVKHASRSLAKKMPTLPESKLWRDHAPAKVDQRKVALEQYLQTIITLPLKDKNDVIAFFTSDIVRARQPVSSAGYKEGYLTKRGKNFGGWKRRYFVLQGSMLEYYESRGGAHLGSISIVGAQIGRQQRSGNLQAGDEENEYRHAFLIIEAKKNPSLSSNRHVLCAESDRDRDGWVEVLVKHVTGNFQDDQQQLPSSSSSGVYNSSHGLSPIHTSNVGVGGGASSLDSAPPRSSTSSLAIPETTPRKPLRGMSKDDISRGPAVPISQLAQDPSNAKLFHAPPPIRSVEETTSPIERSLHGGPNLSASDIPLSSSLPISSPLEGDHGGLAPIGPRSNSELGNYLDISEARSPGRPSPASAISPEHHRSKPERERRRASVQPLKLGPTPHKTPSDLRAPSPDPHTPRVDMNGKVKISGPMNGAPLPAGYNFRGGVGKEKEVPEQQFTPSSSDRREKAKSRMFWGFGRPSASDKPAPTSVASRAVFGISIEESLEVAQIANLPAVVFRCIQYLETKKAELEEGIYRLSGSSAVIKSLKDRFNVEGDVDLLASDEYWDPHAIAGLLKTYMRDLPGSLLTRELHTRFLSVIDFVDAQERIRELSNLIANLPLANYSLLRALTAHLILIVQNSGVNKMTMRNVGIVFSPTLGIPAGVFSLMLGEFNRVFNVDDKGAADYDDPEERRNSKHYTDAAADELLGLAGRSLQAPSDDQSDDGGDEISIQEESEPETTDDFGPSASSGSNAGTAQSRMSTIAAKRGLNLNVATGARGGSGLPTSPRPSHSPRFTPSPIRSPMLTPP